MSEGDLLSSSLNDTLTEEINSQRDRDTEVSYFVSSSPPRSRCQSVGSTHREVLLFFERHQLFQPESETSQLSHLPGIIYENQDFTNREKKVSQDYSDTSSFSKTPSPAHFSDVKSSSDEQNYNFGGNQLLKVPQQRGRSKSDNSTLLVRQGSKSKERDLFFSKPSSTEDVYKLSVNGSNGGNDTNTKSKIQGESPARNRSIRGRSHSQPSQAILSCTEGESINPHRKRSSKKKDKYNWLEQVQFRAQYQHFRTNDYASVVNSASSLDKAGDLSDQSGRSLQIGGRPHQLHQIHHTFVTTDSSSSSQNHSPSPIGALSSGNRNSCWNFPKVKLPRIFNAKSLDDILGRRKSSSVSPLDQEQSTSSDISKTSNTGASKIELNEYSFSKENKNTSLTSLKIFNPSITSTSNLSAHLESGTSGISFSSVSSSVETVCQTTLGLRGSESCQSQSAKTSKGITFKPSTFASVFQRIPQFHLSGNNGKDKKYQKKGGSKEKPSKSQSSGSLNRVSCAKSDNYLNRIIVSATCAKFNVGKSVDNLNSNTSSETDKSRHYHSASKRKSNQACSIDVESYSNSSTEASGSIIVDQPKQRNWTAVKHKWDLKLQQTNPGLSKPGENIQNLIFVKSQLSQISGCGGISATESYEDQTQLESCGTSGRSSLQYNNELAFSTIKPHEAGRVKFRLEPEEIPASPTISRSQSSDCKPIQIDPSLVIYPHLGAEEESEEMTKSRHFHFKDYTSGGRSRRKEQEQDGNGGPNKAPGMTTKEKTQLVVVNLSYLQRPTSPCVLMSPGDPSNSQQSSSSPSPIVFSNNNSNNSRARAPASNVQSIPSSVQSPLSTYQQARLMKQEYLSSGAAKVNLNEPGLIKENINKSFTSGGPFSSFVPPCYNRNDVLSPSMSGSGAKSRNTNEASSCNLMKESSNKTKSSKYGSGDDRLRQFDEDSSHDDMIVYTNRYKDNSRGNKNVTSFGDFASTSRPEGGFGQEFPRFSSGSGFGDSRISDPNGAFSGDYGFDNRVPLKHQNQIGGIPILQSDFQVVEAESSRRNNNFQSTESSEGQDEDEMGDLQSPTYVKRTAHMFNSRHSSQHNGSSPSNVSDPIKENRNPSYLNVSRSVSGYSCLSYNNGVSNSPSTTNGSSCTNGSSPYSQKYVSPSSGKVKSEFTIRVNQPQTKLRDTHEKHQYNDDEDDFINNVEGRLIKSPTSPKSKYHHHESEDRSSETDPSYVPSHGKSFIMQRIERLYGSDAVTSASVFSRSSVNKGSSTVTTTLQCETLYHSPGKGKERVIPIHVQEDEVDRSEFRSSSAKVAKEHQEYERLIRGDEILIQDKKQNEESISPTRSNKNNNSNMKSNKLINNSGFVNISTASNANKIGNGGEESEGVTLEACPGKHRLATISLDEDERQELLLSSSKMKIGDGIRPVTSPSPLKKITVSPSPPQDVNTFENKDQEESFLIEGDKSSIEIQSVQSSSSSFSLSPVPSAALLSGAKDGKYFLIEMNNTKMQLQTLVDRFGKEVEIMDQSSDRAGNMLSAIGKSNLLMKKKFKQFEELCNANLSGATGDQPTTTNDDLAGFWDMVMIQVEQVYCLFKTLDENQESESIYAESSKAKVPSSPRKAISSSTKASKPVVSKPQCNEAAKARDESRRKMLAEKRRLMKNQTQITGTPNSDEIIILTPESN